jgi:hypothetical protein
MEPVTSSGDASFPPPPIFKSPNTPITRSTAVTRLTSNLLPLELNQGTAKSLRIAKDPSPKSGDPTMLPLNSLLEIAWPSQLVNLVTGNDDLFEPSAIFKSDLQSAEASTGAASIGCPSCTVLRRHVGHNHY